MSHLDFHSCFPSFGDKMTYVNNICESEQNGMNGFYVACMCSIEDLFENKNEMVDYAFQDINDIPSALPEGRTKPWGTGQAVLAAKDVLTTPFIVINADDYYMYHPPASY